MEAFRAIEDLNSIHDLSIKDFEDGTIRIDDILEEVNYLKQQIDTLRQHMATFLEGLATIEPNSKPQAVFEEQSQRSMSLQKSLDDYVERYKKLTPLLSLVQQELGIKEPQKQEPSFKPQLSISTPSIASQQAIASLSQSKKAPRKRQYKKRDSSSASTNATLTTGSTNTPPIVMLQQFEDDIPLSNYNKREQNGSANQPILL